MSVTRVQDFCDEKEGAETQEGQGRGIPGLENRETWGTRLDKHYTIGSIATHPSRRMGTLILFWRGKTNLAEGWATRGSRRVASTAAIKKSRSQPPWGRDGLLFRWCATTYPPPLPDRRQSEGSSRTRRWY